MIPSMHPVDLAQPTPPGRPNVPPPQTPPSINPSNPPRTEPPPEVAPNDPPLELPPTDPTPAPARLPPQARVPFRAIAVWKLRYT
jgi:hypothetical protein